jgi:ribonuclease HII
MLVYAGIDEAGYGPLLGPLCVGAAAFVLNDHDPAAGAPDLWRLLNAAVCRRPSDRRRRIAVDDSKRLKGPNDGPAHPLRHLERGVWSFCPFGGDVPDRDDELLAMLDAGLPQRPWLAGTTALPLAHTPDELRIARGRVERAMRQASIRCEGMWCEVVHPEDLNRAIGDCGNKADVNFAAAMRLVDRVWRRWPQGHPRVMIDRHGGRTRYGDLLEAAFTGARAEVVAETPTLSPYTLDRRGSRLTVSFALEGDGRFLPVALASMTAKYVRELVMLRINRFFQGHLPGLRPTAGYRADARRYLAEIKPLMRRLDLKPADLVRRL